MKFVDFFAGIGGIRLGLEQAGHTCVGFCEFDKYARKSYKAIHNTEGEWESHDVRTVKPYDMPEADLWCFGFPCQDISVAGKQAGLEEGARSGLFYEIMRLLAGRRKEDRPRWLLIENVKNLLSISRGFDFARLLCEVGGYGYPLQWDTINSKKFGVPQNRERVFIVGHLGAGSPPKIFPISGADGENTCKLQELTSGVADAYRIYDAKGISRTLKSGGGGLGAKTGLYAIDLSYKDARITEQARCLQARYAKGPCNHMAETSGVMEIENNGVRIRKLTPLECWRLQGFPDEYFHKAQAAGVSDTQLYRQAGNAVTVNVAAAIGRRLMEVDSNV